MQENWRIGGHRVRAGRFHRSLTVRAPTRNSAELSPIPQPPEWVRKPRRSNILPLRGLKQSAFPESRKISLTTFWIISSSTPTSNPSNRVPWYPNHGFRCAGGTSFTPSSSLQGTRRSGSRRSRSLRRVPLIMSRIYASCLESSLVLQAGGFLSTYHGLRTWRR